MSNRDRNPRGSTPEEHSNPTVGDRIFTRAERMIASTTLIHKEDIPRMSDTEIWIGLFDVKPLPGNASLGASKGAYVNVVPLAADRESYVRLVKETMREYEFDVIGHEDVERLADRLQNNNRFHPDVGQLARSLTDEAPIQFDEFQGYLTDNDNE